MKTLFLLSLLLGTPKGWWPIHALGNGYLSFWTSFIYDDNIFRYSKKDLSEFEAGKNPEKYPFLTTDDFITRLTAALSYPGKFSFGLRVTENSFLKNVEKDYINLGVWVSAKGASFEFKKIPRFLLRYYPDFESPQNEYKACRYNLNLLRASYDFRFSPFQLRLLGELSGLHYSPPFMEYDTKGKKGTITLTYRKITSTFSITGFYERTLARAWDQKGEVPETSDDPDISYKRWGVEAKFAQSLKNLPLEFGFSYRWRYKKFTSRKIIPELDPFHIGRKDRDYRVKLETRYRLNRRIFLFLRGTIEKRWVSSPYKSFIYEIKDYKRHIFSIGFRSIL